MRRFKNQESIAFESKKDGFWFIWLNNKIILKSKTQKQHDKMLSNLIEQLGMKPETLN